MAKYALLSVSDKTGIEAIARSLVEHGYQILSTGGTAKQIEAAGIQITPVEDYTGSPEMMDGRVKTLHPKIHGGLLGLRNNAEHVAAAKEHDISWIDVVVVNLYPFAQTIAKDNVELAEAIEQIDIGGPSMIRSAAKNYQSVAVLTSPDQYAEFSERLKAGEIDDQYRLNLSSIAFQHTSHYDEVITSYLAQQSGRPELLSLHYQKVRSLRYGENPHQKAAFFRNPHNHDANVTNSEVLHGKQLSFNNIVDADSAIELVKEFDRPAAVFIKHNNPCGVATSESIASAFALGHQVDSLSAFGCVIAINRPLTEAIVDYIDEQKMFVEIICAPSFEPKAFERLQSRKNLRLLATGELTLDPNRRDVKKVAGGILVQGADTSVVTANQIESMTVKEPTETQVQALLFAQKVCKHVKSNAVVFAKVDTDGNEVVSAIGAGQMSRVDAVHIAVKKGGDRIKDSVMASDAFFPFPDALEQAHAAGAVAFIQPGGSIRDEQVVEKAEELGVSMVKTGIRNFRH